MKLIFGLLFLELSVFGCATNNGSKKSAVHVRPVSKVKWEALNPARGSQSPKAGTLWGDRQGKDATGFLVQFVDGFSSPPHIHNVTYRGIVISGNVHNDDPNAAKMWMPVGSYWTQPKGAVHITAAKGKTNIAYIEIERGSYLVRSEKKAFDSGERPINIDPSNLVWIEKSGSQVSYLWGTHKAGQMHGSFLKIPAGEKLSLLVKGAALQAVVLKGKLNLMTTKARNLLPGTYISANSKAVLSFASSGEEESLIYLRAQGEFTIF